MGRKGNFFYGGPGLFTPTVIRGLTEGSVPVLEVSADQHTGSIQSVTQSFRYDPPGSPIKSTQQISIDWNKFENHTFFNSAEAKVNTAFDVIINSFPFDGARSEYLEFFDRLTGFEKWVYDKFPKFRGFLHFSGAAEANGGTDTGTYIEVKDQPGNYSPTLSRATDGMSVLDQGTKPIAFDFHFHIPASTQFNNQVVLQRLSGSSSGITLALSGTTAAAASGSLIMLVSSGSSYLSASMDISKGDFQHICAVYDTNPGENKIKLYRNFKLVTSSSRNEMGAFGYSHSSLFIGSGSNHAMGIFGPTADGLQFDQTLSGAIDELKVYHKPRTGGVQRAHGKQSVYPDKKLKLYFKFNEPTGSYTSSDVTIDYSGNSLHSKVVGFQTYFREPRGLTHPLPLELTEECPVLFPSYPDVISLNTDLLTSASDYDANNPNLITKLIPKHYLQEASIFEGFGTKELGDAADGYGVSQDFPGGGKLGSAQIIGSFLFVWAKFFDELKMHLDSFGNLMSVDPVPEGTIADTFIPFLAETYGLQMPELFPNTSLDQFYTRKGHKVDTVLSKNNLQYIQNQIWRRILSDMNEILRTKGTIHSIKALMRNMGINPDNNFRFREFGGSRTGRLSDRRTTRTKIIRMLDFSGSFGNISSSLDAQGIPSNRPFLKSSNLLGPYYPTATYSSGRKEPGIPLPGPTAAHNRILTSGSWTYEGTYQMSPFSALGYFHPMTGSLVRFSTSGSTTSTLSDSTFLNLIAFSGSNDTSTTGSLTLVFRDTWSKTLAPKFAMPLTGVNIYDGGEWHIAFGRIRNDMSASIASSSWFLRAGRQVGGRLAEYYETTKLFDDTTPAGNDNSVLSTKTNNNNVSGSVFLIGSQSVPTGNNLYGLSYSSADVSNIDLTTFFGGRVLNTRFWSKALTPKESKEHILNPTSLGVEDPKKNFNFVTTVSGSWEKLRLDLDYIQTITGSDSAGKITLHDMSQNGLHCTGSGFEASKQVIKPTTITLSSLSTLFDQANATNRIRVRSFKDKKNLKKYGGLPAPLHSIPEDEVPIDDTRFSVEVSAVQALNEDIINIFSSLDAFDNYIGSPELQFSDDYPDLAALRDVYFNRLTDKINFKTFFEFFKWFDSTVANLVEMMIPRRTKFLGVNFVIEPHMLERPKMRYNTSDMYVGPNDRHGLKGTILLQQLVGEIKRF